MKTGSGISFQEPSRRLHSNVVDSRVVQEGEKFKGRSAWQAGLHEQSGWLSSEERSPAHPDLILQLLAVFGQDDRGTFLSIKATRLLM